MKIGLIIVKYRLFGILRPPLAGGGGEKFDYVKRKKMLVKRRGEGIRRSSGKGGRAAKSNRRRYDHQVVLGFASFLSLEGCAPAL